MSNTGKAQNDNTPLERPFTKSSGSVCLTEEAMLTLGVVTSAGVADAIATPCPCPQCEG